MAQHIVTIEETKKLSDTLVGYRLRCDGDPTSDSWFTTTIGSATLDADIATAQINVAIKADAWTQHEAAPPPPTQIVTITAGSPPKAVPAPAVPAVDVKLP